MNTFAEGVQYTLYTFLLNTFAEGSSIYTLIEHLNHVSEAVATINRDPFGYD